jgi:hypothetical protein
MLHFALDYAHRGFPVFPCNPANKAPFPRADVDAVSGETVEGTGGFKKASRDPEQIKAWWEEFSNAMIGIPTGSRSGIWAVDPDAPKPPRNIDGRENWAKLSKKNGGHQHTHTHNTPGGGQHIVFAYRADKPVTNREGGLARLGINVRGEGGYIIAPPSMNADGKEYEYDEPLDVFQFAEAPSWLYDLILMAPSISERASAHVRLPADGPPGSHAHRRYAEAAMRGEADDLAHTLTGARNIELNNAALKLGTLVAAKALTESEVIGVLLDASKANGLVADHGERAALATINSGLRKGLETPRVIPSSKAPPRDETKTAAENPAEPASTPEIFWHGINYHRELRPWLIRDLIPQQGQGLASGQWGTGKTFAVLDLAASIMTGIPFAAYEVCRRGGVLFVAAEGANEIAPRLEGVVNQKLRLNPAAVGDANLDKLPFAWIEECPSLKDEASFERLVGLALTAAKKMKEEFNVDLVLIIIDTLSAAADFADANDAAEGQRIMNRLNALSRRTGAFALAVDHFGKDATTGTRGSSAKEAAADVVVALLADRAVNGTLKNTRMAVRKLRGGATGAETPFKLKEVELNAFATTCVVEWNPALGIEEGATKAKLKWPKSLRIFRQALLEALSDAGVHGVPFYDGSEVKWVQDHKVKAEFFAAYPVNSDTEEQKKDAKRAAWGRALKNASELGLIGTRLINGFDYLWVAVDE